MSRSGCCRGLTLPLALVVLLLAAGAAGGEPSVEQGAAPQRAASDDDAAPAGDEPGSLLSDVRLRLGLLSLQRSGGGSAQRLLLGGLRAGRRLHCVGVWSLDAAVGYGLVHASSGTEAASVGTFHHLLDLRGEGQLDLGPLRGYLALGPLVDLVQIHTSVGDSSELDLGWHPGLLYALGVRSDLGERFMLHMEAAGIRRGARNDLLLEVGLALRL